MANYTQYSGGSNSQTTLSQRLLNNGSDYLSVRVSDRQYLILQGDLYLEGSVITYSDCQCWIYTTSSGRTPDLSYSENESGTVTVTVPAYVYSSISNYQHLDVMEVTDGASFSTVALFVFIVVSAVFKSFSRVRNRLSS